MLKGLGWVGAGFGSVGGAAALVLPLVWQCWWNCSFGFGFGPVCLSGLWWKTKASLSCSPKPLGLVWKLWHCVTFLQSCLSVSQTRALLGLPALLSHPEIAGEGRESSSAPGFLF